MPASSRSGSVEDARRVHAAGPGRDALVQAVVSLRRAPLARRRSRPSRRRRRSGGTAGTASGRTSTTTTSSPCRTSGSTRGTRPGTSRFTRSRSRSSTPTSRRTSSCCSCASGTCTRTARFPPTSGPSATSTRRCTPGRPGACTRSTSASGAKATARFLERVFQKLLLNFNWWVNRKDLEGKNVFQGGFLGLDNIGVFDRSAPLPTGGHLEQSDGTAWMGSFCLNMLAMALELARDNPAYEDMASKFFEHFMYIAHAMGHMGADGEHIDLWHEDDGFFYDVLHTPDGAQPMKVRSLVGLVPLFSVQVIEPEDLARLPQFAPADAVVPRQPRRPPPPRHQPGGPGRHGAATALAGERRAAAAGAPLHARRGRVPLAPRHPRAVPVSRGAALRAPRQRDGAPGGLRAGRVLDAALRRQLELARADLVPDELPHHRVAAALRSLLPRTSSRSSSPPDPDSSMALWDVADGAVAAPHAHLPAGSRRPASGARRATRRSRPIRTGATWCCSTSTSTATTAPASAPATRPAGRASWQSSCSRAGSSMRTARRTAASECLGDESGVAHSLARVPDGSRRPRALHDLGVRIRHAARPPGLAGGAGAPRSPSCGGC